MKKYFITAVLFCSFVLLLTGCSKESPTQPEFDNIYGTWNLVKLSGGYAGGESVPEAGKVYTIKITRDNYYSEYLNDQQKFQSRFEIRKEHSITSNKNTPFICFDNGQTFPRRMAILQASHNELLLSDDCYDGFIFTYKRISKQR